MSLDLLVLGSTGLTGRLITRYLLSHPEKHTFSLGVSGRSEEKVQRMLDGLGISINDSDRPKILVVDVSREEQIDEAVAQAKVIINTCGPYWTYGTPVVQAAVKHKRHYLDLAGDVNWIRTLIPQFDATARKNSTAIVHCCAFDSLPSEVGPYLANKTLKAFAGDDTQLDTSVSSFSLEGGISAGTLNSMFTAMEAVPKDVYKESRKDFAISPVKGNPYPRVKFWYKLRDAEIAKNRIGMMFPMTAINKHIVQREWGLFEQDDDQSVHYGPKFTYDEFFETGSRLISVVGLLGFIFFFVGASCSQWIRNYIRKALPEGYGLKDEHLEKGWFVVTNITKSVPTPSHPKPITVKTIFRGKGDPGYLGTSIMIAEGALIALRGKGRKQGGILTPLVAFGDDLVENLKATGRFEFESRIVDQPTA